MVAPGTSGGASGRPLELELVVPVHNQEKLLEGAARAAGSMSDARLLCGLDLDEGHDEPAALLRVARRRSGGSSQSLTSLSARRPMVAA